MSDAHSGIEALPPGLVVDGRGVVVTQLRSPDAGGATEIPAAPSVPGPPSFAGHYFGGFPAGWDPSLAMPVDGRGVPVFSEPPAAEAMPWLPIGDTSPVDPVENIPVYIWFGGRGWWVVDEYGTPIQPFTAPTEGRASQAPPKLGQPNAEGWIFDESGYAVNFVPSEALDDQAAIDHGPVVPNPQLAIESYSLIGLSSHNNNSTMLPIRGAGAIVVIDDGFRLNHQQFGLDENGNGVADRILVSYDFAGTGLASNPDADVQVPFVNEVSHGTHVAGIAAGSQVFPGVAPEAKLILFKVITDPAAGSPGQIKAAAVNNALAWVAQYADAYNVIAVNMSVRFPETPFSQVSAPEPTIGAGLAAVAAKGIPIIGSSSNFFASAPWSSVNSISADPNVWGVGAVVDRNIGVLATSHGTNSTTGPDIVAAFSQRNPTLTDMMAPGGRILSGANDPEDFRSMSGTSMSAPFVAGTVSLMQDLSLTMTNMKLSVSDLLIALKSGAQDIFDSNDSTPNPGYLASDPREADNVINTDQIYDRLSVPGALNGVIAYHLRPATEGADVRAGWASNDTIVGLGGNDVLYGHAGQDLLLGWHGNDIVYGGDGADTIYGGTSAADTVAPNGSDTVLAGAGDDLILAGGDSIALVYGDGGNDVIYGGSDNDTLFGGQGVDKLYLGQGGNDLVIVPFADMVHDPGLELVYGFGAGDILALNASAQSSFVALNYGSGAYARVLVSGGQWQIWFDGITAAQLTAQTQFWAS
jgi:hypothetical protein